MIGNIKGGGSALRNYYNFTVLGALIIFLLGTTTSYAQFDDDEFDVDTEEIECVPESLNTVYDKYDFKDVTFDNIRQWYSFGSEYYKNKNYKSALPYLWKVFINDSTKYARNAVRKMADSYFQLQQADSTLIVCYRGLAVFPDHAILHYFAGFIQDNLGKVECAIPHYEAMVKDNPEKPEYLEKLAFLYYKREDEKAIQIQTKLVDLEPTNSKYANDLALYSEYFYGAGGGLEAFKKAWENDPENLEFAFKYGKAAYDAGEYKAALTPLNAVIKKNPNHTEAHQLIAMCDESLENYNEAIVEYKKILQIDAENAQIMCAIASDYRNMNQFSNAQYWVNKALKAKPGFGLAHMIMAEVYESAVPYCQNKGNRKRKYDDGLVYEMAKKEYEKALSDPNYKADARRRINSLRPYLPTKEEKFMNQNRKNLKDSCYTSWIK
jgi:tetratricopeptide (TPR) repeat protein